MAFSKICRICLSVNVNNMFVLKKTGLQNLFKTLTNSLMDEDEKPIIVCFMCHARLVSCKRLQQQAIESNALLAGGSMSTPKPHEARDKIQLTPIYHIDIRPVKYDVENDCKDESFRLESVKAENGNYKFEVYRNHETEQPCMQTNNFLKPSEKKKGKHSTRIIKKKTLNREHSVNILTKNTSEASTKYKLQQTPVPQVINTYKCDICEFKTSYRCRIAAHLKAHVAKQVYCCNNCDYKCTHKGSLARHVKIHNGEKPFLCNICEYRSITKSHLQMHMKKHTGEKPFSCNICVYKCTTNSNLQKHMKIHTGEKPFSCNICVYKCITNSNLQKHMKIHTGEKPFLCNICEYRSITKSYLQTHMKIHTGEKPFSCNICKYKSITNGNLRRHLNIHTGAKSSS